jgi:polysaccharide export outer membrane protein
MVLLVQAGGGIAQQPSSPAPASAPPLNIASGDLLEVSLFGEPDLSGRFRVNEKGDITVPLIGMLHVEGETAEKVATAIEQRYVEANILRPNAAYVTVFIAEYATQGIVVNGEVKTPGLYPALGIRKLNDVIAAAGGVTQFASTKVLIAHRNDPDNPVSLEYSPTALTPIIPQVQIFPGDTVTVPRAGIVYVLGAVQHPGGFVLDGRDGLTVMKALALAAGSGRAPAMNRVQLMRSLEGGRKEEIILPLKRILQGKSPDVAMKDGDILFVPTSNGLLATEQALSSALGIGTSVLIYRVGYQ